MVRIAHDRTYINQMIAQQQAMQANAQDQMARAQSEAWFAGNSAARAEQRISEMQGEIAAKQVDMASWASIIASQQHRNIENLQQHFMSFLGAIKAQKANLESQLATQQAQLDTIMDNMNERLTAAANKTIPEIHDYVGDLMSNNNRAIEDIQQRIDNRDASNVNLSALIHAKAGLVKQNSKLQTVRNITSEALKPENKEDALFYLTEATKKLATNAQKEFIQKYRQKYNCSEQEAIKALPKVLILQTNNENAEILKDKRRKDTPSQWETIDNKRLYGFYVSASKSLNSYFRIVKEGLKEGLYGNDRVNQNKPAFTDFEKQCDEDYFAVKDIDKTMKEVNKGIEDVKTKASSVNEIDSKVNRIQASVESHSSKTSDILNSLEELLKSQTTAMAEEAKRQKSIVRDSKKLHQKHEHLFADSEVQLAAFKGRVEEETEYVRDQKDGATDQANEIMGDLYTLTNHADHDLMIPLSFTNLRGNPFHERKRRFMHPVTFKNEIMEKQSALESLDSSQQSRSFNRLKSSLATEIGRAIDKTYPQHLRFRPMHNPTKPGQDLTNYAGKYEKVSFQGRNYVRHALEAYDEQYRRL